MATWIDRLTTSRTTNAALLTARFAEARHHVLAENVANVDTPDYAARQLDPTAFQRSLREALSASKAQRRAALELRSNAQFAVDTAGRATVRPGVRPAQNVLFHDGTNARMERLMADVVQNQSDYELATTILRGRFDELLRAIRGRSA